MVKLYNIASYLYWRICVFKNGRIYVVKNDRSLISHTTSQYRKWRNLLKLIIIICFFIVGQKPSEAQVIDSIYYNWVVYENIEKEECYIGTALQDSMTSHTADRNAYILITYFTESNVQEVSINSGYEYKINSGVHILVDDRQFKFFTKGDTSWSTTKELDKEIIQLMLQSRTIKVRSDSAIGTYAIDEYSMKGLVRAYARMKELCT